MKKLLAIGLLAIWGCNGPTNVQSKKTTYVISDDYPTLEVATVDSCEYLFGRWGNATVLTHKGNCRHCKK